MYMKPGMQTWRPLAFAGWLALVLFAAGCTHRTDDSAGADQYTCPMHPTVVSPTQGACPVCGMDLVRKAREGEQVKITEDLLRVLPSPSQWVVAATRTIKGSYRSMPIAVELPAVITYDTRRVQALSSRVSGRLERVFVRYAQQTVRSGQKLAEVYSPEMLTAQRELLFLATHDSGNAPLIQEAKEKLLLLGATVDQIDAWLQKGEVDPLFAITSPIDGYVILPDASPADAAPASTAGMMGGSDSPSSSNSSPPSSGSPLVREGEYVGRGQTLFTIASKDAFRVELSVPAERLNLIRPGDKVMVRPEGGKELTAQVAMIEPFFADGASFLKVRVNLQDGDLRVGQLATVTFMTTSAESLWLPRDAVYALGATTVVFVKERGVFKPRRIVPGERADGWIEVRRGLTSADEVAAQAAYLVDSESFIKQQ